MFEFEYEETKKKPRHAQRLLFTFLSCDSFGYFNIANEDFKIAITLRFIKLKTKFHPQRAKEEKKWYILYFYSFSIQIGV